MINIREEYESRKNEYKNMVKREDKTIRLISNLRLVAFLAGVVATLFYYITREYYICIAVLFAFVILFTILVKLHNRAIERRNYASALLEINEKAIMRIDGQWKDFEDTGEEFINDDHSYSGDLDIFGKGSLFQWINSTVTYLGREKLRELLESPCKGIDDITKRQEAVEELAGKLDFRQVFASRGVVAAKERRNPEDLFLWGRTRNNFYCNPLLNIFMHIWPVVTIAILILPLLGKAPFYVAPLMICVNVMILMWDNESRSNALGTVDKYKENMNNYYGMLRTLEMETFHSSLIKSIKSNLVNEKGDIASEQIRKLFTIEEKVSGRRNAFYTILNILTLKDYRYMRALEMWKRNSGDFIEKWINAIGDIEALGSLSIIKFDNPSFAMAKFTEGESHLLAKNIGHPLLGENRVCNDLNIKKPSDILLITGSNMSGKSTLLRTAGINLVLAYAGAPVCADEFSCSIMEIYTCMRVSDDLERNISSFYAELLRIKKIVEAAKTNKHIFFLLDEIFKGTNSMDRHTGAKVLIKKLMREGAIGLVSTHDLELSELERESGGRIKNYHFKEYYEDDKIHFDYKLRSGVSTTRNAMYLIKMAGIDED